MKFQRAELLNQPPVLKNYHTFAYLAIVVEERGAGLIIVAYTVHHLLKGKKSRFLGRLVIPDLSL